MRPNAPRGWFCTDTTRAVGPSRARMVSTASAAEPTENR
jgi:hypothetical protein